jgi:thioredoxin 1
MQADEAKQRVENLYHVTSENFDHEVLRSTEPVFVDFWASWCGPCRAVAPTIEKLASEYKGRVKFGKLNVDENPDLAMKYNVQSIPTLIIFKDGKEVSRLVGAGPKQMYVEQIESVLSSSSSTEK